jgi:hypothetical protein
MEQTWLFIELTATIAASRPTRRRSRSSRRDPNDVRAYVSRILSAQIRDQSGPDDGSHPEQRLMPVGGR